MEVRANKITSVVYRLKFKREVPITDEIECATGNTIVVRALAEKRVYNELELQNGRMATIFRGDVIVGALGKRRALRGFCGDVPASLKPGDPVKLLNRGGVIGTSTSDHKDLGQPITCEVLGQPVRDGKVVCLSDARLPETRSLAGVELPPLVVVSGTSMDSGKTFFLSELIKELSKEGLSIAGGKLTGIACLRDLNALQDHGAVATASFLDAGYPSTAGLSGESLVVMAKTVVGHLAGAKASMIFLELGDGIVGDYGVLDILRDPEFRAAIRMHVFCAGDMVGAWGGCKFLEAEGIPVDLFSGPVTDTEVGVEFLETKLKTRAINAHRNPERLAEAVRSKLGT